LILTGFCYNEVIVQVYYRVKNPQLGLYQLVQGRKNLKPSNRKPSSSFSVLLVSETCFFHLKQAGLSNIFPTAIFVIFIGQNNFIHSVKLLTRGYYVKRHLKQYFSYFVVVSLISGGNRKSYPEKIADLPQNTDVNSYQVVSV
jgi:hypothetical protein